MAGHPYPSPRGAGAGPARNGPATAGFALGVLGLIFSLFPFIGVIAWPLVILGLVFAAMGLDRAVRKRAPAKRLAIAGLSISLTGLVMCAVWIAGIAHDINQQANQVTEVHYQVTGTAHDATITYSVFGDGGSSTNQENARVLPWSTDVRISGPLKASSLTITTGAGGGTITCAVVVDGKETRTSTASGPFAVASCDGF